MDIRRVNAADRPSSICRCATLTCALLTALAFSIISAAARAYDIHFDYTSFDTNFQQAQFDVLNYPSINGNYMMTSTDNHRPEMVANGNNLAEFYNWVQQRYDAHTTKDGNLSADEIDAYVVNYSNNNGPKPNWLILNEISSSLWSANPGSPSISTYRTWLLNMVTRLKDYYGYNVVTLAPFQNPGANDASWQALSQVSYVGIECYLSGTEVWNSGSSYSSRVAWAQSQYQSSKNSYLNRGVPASKLFVTEHFANNAATYIDGQGNVLPTGWGRAGLASAADWDSVLQIRQDAILNVGFAGFLAYNWGGNGLGVTQAEQIQHEYYYRTRLVLPGQKPQWLSDAAINVNGTTIPLSWSQPLNWIGGVPNSGGAQANFWRTLTTSRSITLDGNKTIGTMTFDSPYSYTINPGTGGSIIFNNLGSTAALTSTQGSHNFNADVQLLSNLAANISTSTLTIAGTVSSTGSITKTGAGTLVLSATNTYTGNTSVTVGKLTLNKLFLADTADVYLSTGATLDLKFSGVADVIDSLFINGLSQAAGIWGAIGSGAPYTSSLLTGTGRLQVMTFIPLPLVGDYNQDGIVDAADYAKWRNSVGTATLPNRDPANTGAIGQADYNTWRARFGQSVLGSGSGAAAGMSDSAAVPEPTGVTLCCAITAIMVFATGRRASSRLSQAL